MSKQGEIDYFKSIGEEGKIHAYNKPFSDPKCGSYLFDIGAILSLLPPPPAKLLDLGVGSGWTSIFFAQRGYDVVGQDIAGDSLELANANKKRYGVDNVEFIRSDYEEMDFDNEFDCAVFYDCLHHAIDEKKTVQSVYNALKADGVCIFIEPGMGHSKSPKSIMVVREWDVTEKDMPPAKIIKIGKEVGFKKHKVFLRSGGPLEVAPYYSIKGFINTCRVVLRAFPLIGVLKTNIVVLTK
jgi:SAM-dependent methyltransferase